MNRTGAIGTIGTIGAVGTIGAIGAIAVACCAALLAACATAGEAGKGAEKAADKAAAKAEGALANTAAATSALLTDPAPVTEGDVTAAWVNGMQVVVKRLPGAELATVQLYVRGGARNWGKEDAGVELLALRAATSGGLKLGDKQLDKEAFGNLLSSLGVALNAETGRDWSAISGKGPVAQLKTTLALVSAAFLQPALPAAEVELTRQRQLLGLKRRAEQPDGRLDELVTQALWAGHPYANRPDGTVESVAAIKPEQVAAHLAKLRETSRLLLVVTGDVDAATVQAEARLLFAGVPRGSYAPAPLAHPAFAAPKLSAEQRALPTNYLQGMTAGPAMTSAEFAAARVLNAALAERMFEEVRTKRNLSYAPGTRFDVTEAGTLLGIYVTAVDPNTTLKVMLDELQKSKDTAFPELEVAAARSQYRTNFTMQAETTDGQASLLARGALLAGDWRWAGKFQQQVDAVTAADVQALAKKYLSNLQVVLLGDPSKLDAKLATSL